MAQAKPLQWVQSIESFVDSSSSPAQQDASLDAIASLLKNDKLTIEALVREMEMYLTTTDNIIRARGILLLAELLARLASKPLDNATLHSLIGFFTERLADWKALHGALVGCVALMGRKSNVGMATVSDARAVAESYLQNLQVQSLGQHDRKLCFELLECLLDRYPDAVASLGDDLVYGICEAIDGEKDPQCLLLTFHIVELLARLFPDPAGPLASFSGDLFDILGCYFPIHFTHPQGEDLDLKKDDLSRALMQAFSSTPIFEPFAIPLLLEKLSSSLPLAKVESLKYLSSCTLKYGAERMAKHAEAIWASLKNAVYSSIQDPVFSFNSESHDGMGFWDNEIVTEALMLLQKVMKQKHNLFLTLVVSDKDMNMFINSMTSFKSFRDIPLQSKQQLYAVGRILSVSAKASIASCGGVFGSFFPRLMDCLGFSMKNSSGDCSSNGNCMVAERLNVGALYLCVELLSACRDLILDCDLAPESFSGHDEWHSMLHSFSSSLSEAFCSSLVRSVNDEDHDFDFYVRVRGLQIMASFPGGFLPISKSIFENILMILISIITVDNNSTLLWKLALKAVVQTGSFIDKYNESDKALSYMSIVVEKIVSLITVDDFILPFHLKLEALSEVGTSGLKFIPRVIEGLEEAISANFSVVYVNGNLMPVGITIQLLECYSNKMLPYLHKIGGFEESLLRFAVNIWNQIENSMPSGASVQAKELLDAMMTAMKLAVGSCSEKSQTNIIEKAYSVVSSSSFLLKESMMVAATNPVEMIAQDLDSFSCRDEWLTSLFASVIIALRPETNILNLRAILNLFMSALLRGHVPAAQALGSVLNKLPIKVNGAYIQGDGSLEEALDIIFSTRFWNFLENISLRRCTVIDEHSDITKCTIVNGKFLEIHAIAGLAWMGKGLLMRGHQKVKDITMILMGCLLSNGEEGALPLKQGSLDDSCEHDLPYSMMKSASDAFHILMSDSEVCLNRKFHATTRPLYKQRFFSTMMPVLLSSIVKSDSSITRLMLYRAFGHVVSDAPLTAILAEANKIVPVLLDSLTKLSKDFLNKDLIYSLLLVLSGVLTDKNGKEAVIENAHIIINCLSGLVSYPCMMLVRETAIQCLIAMADLPHRRIYPMRPQVLWVISKALDDPKRAVRQEAVRCRHAWASTA
ncbi:MMS19 nucleotide excision repair protein homolog [Malania oleifera]|uniref:MMS19 nucleotide excision repair protein homolog n=1 Tax=Malania oleifera TaxID=397392 RepID=UPI0025ADA75A|nr:MMS19 nucleotide excision repair protein homolog [Malania oleifera]XP_057978066.1 MMS19 nucleotide excision repair protein homolog [Malania oleifera]